MSFTQSFFLARTSYVRLGRLKDWQQTTARCRPRMDMQSSLTRGVAVAVSARMGTWLGLGSGLGLGLGLGSGLGLGLRLGLGLKLGWARLRRRRAVRPA